MHNTSIVEHGRPHERSFGGFALAVVCAAAILTGSSGAEARAQEQRGYVLSLELKTPGDEAGKFGHIKFDLSSGKNDNNWTGTFIVCSQGGKNTPCNEKFLQTEAGLMNLFRSLHQAQEGDQKVGVFIDGGQVTRVVFYGDGV